MNKTLANLYQTGMEKSASADEVDLTQISAADFLEAIEELEGSEKVAGEEAGDYDLSDLSDEDLLQVLKDVSDEDQIEKMASTGDLGYWDAAGRTMARSFVHEKLAGDDSMDIDLNTFSAEELVELAAHLEGDLEKEASGEGIDLNEFTADEIIDLGYLLQEDMEKEAGEEGEIDLNELTVDELIDVGYLIQEDMEKVDGARENLRALLGAGSIAGAASSKRARSARSALESRIRGAQARAKGAYEGVRGRGAAAFGKAQREGSRLERGAYAKGLRGGRKGLSRAGVTPASMVGARLSEMSGGRIKPKHLGRAGKAATVATLLAALAAGRASK